MRASVSRANHPKLLVDEESQAFRVSGRGCAEILGASLGHREFCEAYASKRVEENRQTLKAISTLEDPQIALRLLRTCASSGRMAHTMRTTPVEHLRNS